MKTVKLALFGLLLASASLANAKTYSCHSMGEDDISFEVILKTNLFGTEIQSGSYEYQSASSDISGSGEFTCQKPTSNMVTFCDPSKPDPMIQRIAGSRLGFMIQQTGQNHVTLFECKFVSYLN